METKHSIDTKMQMILDHLLPVPAEYPVNPKYLYNCDKYGYWEGFRELREVIISIYREFVKFPLEYDIPTPNLMNVLYNLSKEGELREDELLIDPAKYLEISQKKWVGYKGAKNSSRLIQVLCQYGFSFTGLKGKGFDKKADTYVLSYPKNPEVMKALKGYSMAFPEGKHFSEAFIHLDYSLVVDTSNIPSNQEYMNYLSYFQREDRLFLQSFHEGLLRNGFSYQLSYEYRLRYFRKEKDKNYTVECQSYGRKLFLGLKLKNMDRYSDYIHALPAHIKQMFCRNSCRPDCNFQGATPAHCRFRIIWHVDNTEYRKCSFEDVFVPPAYNPQDVNYYVELLAMDK